MGPRGDAPSSPTLHHTLAIGSLLERRQYVVHFVYAHRWRVTHWLISTQAKYIDLAA